MRRPRGQRSNETNATSGWRRSFFSGFKRKSVSETTRPMPSFQANWLSRRINVAAITHSSTPIGGNSLTSSSTTS